MDNKTPEPVRIDPPMTVEAAEPYAAEPRRRAPKAAACAHRTSWRRFPPVVRLSLAEQDLHAAATAAVALALLLSGAILLYGGDPRSWSLPGLDEVPLAAGAIQIATGLLLIPGPAAVFTIHRFPHRPRLGARNLHLLGSMLLIGQLFLLVPEREWAALLAIPPYVVFAKLGVMRRILTDPRTCRAEPGLPPVLKAWRLGGIDTPQNDAEREFAYGPRIQVPGYDSWTCTHVDVWNRRTLRAKIETVLSGHLYDLYTIGGFVAAVAALLHADRLREPLGLDRSVFIVCVGVAVALNLYVRQVWNGSVQLHRGPIANYWWAGLAVTATTALAGWEALLLDRPYLWAALPIGVLMLIDLAESARVLTLFDRCKANPELHPRMRARLRD